MKVRISKTMRLPMLCGIVVALVVVGGPAYWLAATNGFRSNSELVIGISCILLLAVVPALRRGAWVYTNARKYHTAEYLYSLGNGAEMAVAVDGYEKKVKRAVKVWLKRKLLKESFGVLPVLYFIGLISGGGWMGSLMAVALMALMVLLGVFLGMIVMLLAARRMCYDKYGNIKNN